MKLGTRLLKKHLNWMYTFAFLFSINTGFSQFFPDSNAVWEVSGSRYEPDVATWQAEDVFLYRYSVEGDTLISGLNYSKIYLSGYYENNAWSFPNPPNPQLVNLYTLNFDRYFGGVREQDSVVYFLDTNNVETLVMKFNVKTGDTLYALTPEQCHYGICNFGFETDTLYVDSVRDEIVNGKNFRSVYLGVPGWGTSESYTQNLGKRNGLFWNYYPDISNCFFYDLTEFCWEGESYKYSWSNQYTLEYNQNCTFMQVDHALPKYAFYPNPTNGTISLEVEGLSETIRLEIRNTLGQIIQTVPNYLSKQEINMSNFDQGTYFVSVFADGTYYFTEKVIKVD